MAVKVMLAPAIAKADAHLERKKETADARPKRRRSSVFDADGNEVFITLLCLKCRKVRPLSQFGLRRMADGAIRNQPWCRACRSDASADNPKRARIATAEKAPAASQPQVAEAPSGGASPRMEEVVDPGTLAAQVVAALHGGRR
jgi:hypothetical protein